MTRPTLIEHIRTTERLHPGATGELSRILARLSLAGRMVAQRLLNAGFLGEHGETGIVNVQGERVQKLDELADHTFVRVFESLGSVCAVASEERAKIHAFDDEESQSGKYMVLFDPLDGSGNIDINGSLGSIFSVHQRESIDVPVHERDFLKRGDAQVAAGYILYGPATVFVYTAGEDGPVNGFTLDRSIGEFFLTHSDIRMPEGGGSYSVNESNESKWDDKTKELVASFRQGRAPVGKRAARYTGALVADFHRTLLQGGIFLYPGLTDRPRGKLRYLYEAAPLAKIAERAGGAASDGLVRSLELDPKELHERCPLFVGSRADVEYAVESLR
ncbi:MAG: class 1 fructose-bisphosphatase [Planctomycetes bacterium]|nr:class 1 fructose-bisphosphatase [Planctomycetota bacterium]MCB9918948.1 class 1 fructose-bisphosphatase [Planctomycetota bacterium]